MIGATEIEKGLRGFKLGPDRRMLNESHEFTEELATQSEGSLVLQINVTVLALGWAKATVFALGDVGKAGGLVCSGEARGGIGDGRGAGRRVSGVAGFPKDAIHGSECGALHRLQET